MLEKGNFTLPAKTVKAAKTQVKRLFPDGGFITGFVGEEAVYSCLIRPQSAKGPGGRSAFSSRHAPYQALQGCKVPKDFWTTPERFVFQPMKPILEMAA
jgi:hypothetical protein